MRRERKTAGLDQLGPAPSRVGQKSGYVGGLKRGFRPHDRRPRAFSAEEQDRVAAFRERRGINAVRPLDAKHSRLKRVKNLLDAKRTKVTLPRLAFLEGGDEV